MLIDAAQVSAEDLRNRVSNVRDAPIDTAIEKNCECIYFDFNGKTYLGELRGRNRDLCIDTRNPEAEANKAIAVRVLLDRNASLIETEQATRPERKLKRIAQVSSDTRIAVSTTTGSCVMTVAQFVVEYGMPTLDPDNPKCHFHNNTDVKLFKKQLAEQGVATVPGFEIKLAK